jgi:hypothetical protein
LNRRQEQTDQNTDDRDDDEQFDEGEAATAAKRREKLRTKLHSAFLVEQDANARFCGKRSTGAFRVGI